MASFDAIGAFGLSEPDVGSGVARGLTTTTRRDGDSWVLRGSKRWIGLFTFADAVVIWPMSRSRRPRREGSADFVATRMTGEDRSRAGQNADKLLGGNGILLDYYVARLVAAPRRSTPTREPAR